MSSSHPPDYEAPDWLPDPTSDEARQQTLNLCDGDVEQAKLTAYMSGYFEGEGCIRIAVSRMSGAQNGYQYDPRVALATAQMAGLFDAEGCINQAVSPQSDCRLNHSTEPRLLCRQNEDETILEELFKNYCSTFGVKFNVYKSDARDENSSPTVQAHVRSAEHIRNFLAPLLPLLREKRRQAVIMLREILPRYEAARHHTKRGFIEMMRWKRELDRQKPMGDEDRKYTVEYFEDLWGDEIEEQGRLGDFEGEDDD